MQGQSVEYVLTYEALRMLQEEDEATRERLSIFLQTVYSRSALVELNDVKRRLRVRGEKLCQMYHAGALGYVPAPPPVTSPVTKDCGCDDLPF